MVFSNRMCERLIIAMDFPPFSINSIDLKYLKSIQTTWTRHLERFVSDDNDIKHEIPDISMQNIFAIQSILN